MLKSGTCHFCGQTALVEVPDDMEDQDRIDYEAMLQCNCDTAKKVQLEELNKERAMDNIDGLFKDCPKIADYLKLGVQLITSGELENLSIRSEEIGGSVKKKASGRIQVTRTKSEKWSIET